ncbi:MAG: peptide chain release factor N(5)-glutamine methyltransferase [Gammaproteobacteria bacterium]|nr:peptide chain release factor N(5)-glutamine methyltransferase [Gammaproteobacteria bacterium]
MDGLDQPATIQQLLATARRLLAGTSDSAALDGEVLLAHTLGRPRSYLLAFAEHRLTAPQHQHYLTLIQQRSNGTPIAYLTGVREFWSLPLQVSADTLIPRPETERLVELALQHIPLEAAWRIADLGTGSGAIALALASERPRCTITAIERSAPALIVARDNAKRLQLDNIEFRTGDWLEPCSEKFNVIVSNPPYLADDDPHLQQSDLRFEPVQALCAGPDGMEAIRLIAAQARSALQPQGWLLLEHGCAQGPAARDCLQQLGYSDVSTHQDYAGLDRVVSGQWR